VYYRAGVAWGRKFSLRARRFFELWARARPTVLVFEDLHWMDESSVTLLEHLLPLVERAPHLIVGLSRPEQTPAARLRVSAAREYRERYREITLAPLSADDSAQLLRNLVTIEDLPAHTRELIVSKAEGNPFFLEEVIRTLIDSGAVVRDASTGRWRTTAQVESLTIPDTIQGVIMARVDRLDEELKQVLRVASVIGRSFLYRILRAIAQADQKLDEHLAALQQIELIREKQHAPELEYIFKHALAQEATYESILLQKRRELHARVAQVIETLFVDRLEEFYGLLAYHYSKAELWEKAQAYLLRAGDQAGRIAADAEAVAHYEQALTAYARVFGDKWDPVQRAALERKMGEAFWRRGDYAAALEHSRRGLGYLGYRLPITRWEVRRAVVRELLVQVGHRLNPGLFVKPIRESMGPRLEDEALIYIYTAYIDAFTNAERYLLLVLRLLNLSERRGYPVGVVLGYFGLGYAFDILGLSRPAGWYHRLAANVAEELQQPYAIGFAYLGLQLHETYLGELGHSIDDGRRSAQACNEAKDLVTWGLASTILAVASTHRGCMADGVAYAQQMIRLGQDAGARNVWCWGEVEQGYAVRRQGLLQEAMAHQQKAIELAEAIPDYLFRIIAGSELALCHLRQANWQAALVELEACQRVATEHHVIDPYGLVPTLNNLAEAYLFVVEHRDPSERATWMSKAKGACRAALNQSPKYRTKMPKAMRLQGTCEWLSGKPANARRWWQRSLAAAERLDLRYDEGMIHLEMGQRLGEPAHLEKAEAIFAEIGAAGDLARTRELLGAGRINLASRTDA
jgi:tetratricopeptide (TPR) repeat protein